MDWNCPACEKGYSSYRSVANHYNLTDDESHTGNALAEIVGCSTLRDLYAERSENQLADHLAVTRPAVKRALEYCTIPRRGQSEAEEHKWERMSSEERQAQVKAAHEASRSHPQLDVSVRGYERIRHGRDKDGRQKEFKHHRLLATLLVDDIRELRRKHVHHELPVWPDGPDEVAQAVNFLDNLEVLGKADHHSRHADEIPRDERGRFE